MWLKAAYDLSDFLSWTYDKNRTFFDFVAEKAIDRLQHELTQNFYNISYRKTLIEACGLEYEDVEGENQDEINSTFYDISMYCHSLLDDKSREYLYSRGITDEQISRHKIGSNARYNPLLAMVKSGRKSQQHCFFYPPLIEIEPIKEYFGKSEMTVITFPFFDAAGTSVTNLCCRVLDNDYTEVLKFFFSHGRTAIFNSNNINLLEPFYVFEGVFDTLTAERFGIPSVALGSSSLHNDQIKFISDYKDQAVLCLDGDIAGVGGMERVSGFKRFDMVKGFDPDDILRQKPEYADVFKRNFI